MEEYPNVIKLNRHAYTYEFKDGTRLTDTFLMAGEFSEGLAPVKLKDGWTFIDTNGKVWLERFDRVGNFSEGLAYVELKDGLTYVNKNHRIWKERFEVVYQFKKGLASVTLKNGYQVYIDKGKRIFSKEDYDTLIEIYDKPEHFLDLPTEKFKDTKFVESALMQVKGGLAEIVKNKEDVNDDYAKYCIETLNACKERVKSENKKLIALKKEEKNKQKAAKKKDERKAKLVDTIKDFKF